jgi:signal transduction histidine kinase
MPDTDAPKPRILFVEDEVTLREHLAEQLSDEYVVDTAGNGNEALLAVMRAKPALVVSDIVMPDMDGVELLKTLRASPGTRGIPVLLISGRAADAYRIEGFEQGADGFLAKPYTERELRALIGAMLRSAQSRAAAAVRQGRDQVEQQTAMERVALKRALADLHAREEQHRQNQLWFMRAEESLKDTDRRKNAFLAVLAHQLHNCLAPIRSGLEVLRLRSSADELSQRAVSTMDRHTLHLLRLVDDLVDVSRISSGSIALKRQKIGLTDVLANAVEVSRPVIEARAHELIVDVPSTIPAFVDGDLPRLTQVFSNLLSNSAKYTDRGGTITLTLDRQGEEAVVRVRDTGIGIAPHALERVFEMFSQVGPGDAQSSGGLGIGLAVVRKLTQLHGGSVSASSKGPGTGSVFTVRLPLEGIAIAAPAASDGFYGQMSFGCL